MFFKAAWKIIIWGLGKKIQPMNTAEQKLVWRFYESNRHITAPFIPGAKVAVRDLMAAGYPIYVCTANKHSDKSDQMYRDYLIENFGKFADIHFVSPGTSKLDYYQKIKSEFPNDEIIVVDDSARHCDAAKSIGLSIKFINKKHGYKNLAAAFADKV